MNSNSNNPKVGKDFQNKVKQWFETDRNTPLYLEHAINIGTPSRPHKFDISDMDEDLVIECKCYTWTDSGNIPSAKLRGLNEAIFYFSFLPPQTEKILVMAHAVHPQKSETLAEYYYRTNGHLLGDVKLMEFHPTTNTMRLIAARQAISN